MSKIASARINSFGTSPKVDFESHSEEPVFILTSGQLSALITKAIEKAIQPLQDEVSTLRDEHDKDLEEIAVLRATVAALETRQEEDTSRLALDIAYDRQRLAKLEKGQCSPPATPPPGSKTVSRIEKVKDFLKTRGGGATFQECERLLGIQPNQMTRLVSLLDMRSWEIFARAGDLRQKVLRLKAGRLFT